MHTSSVLNTFSYWQFKMQNSSIDEILFSNDKAFDKNSVFAYFAYVDTEKDIFKCGWSIHENQEALTGYLTHVIAPTIYLNWLEEKLDSFYLPMSEFCTIQKAVKLEAGLENEQKIILEYKYSIPNTTCLEEANNRINELLNNRKKKVYVRTFCTREDLLETLHELIPFEDLFEETVGMSLKDFNQMVLTLEEKPFLSKRFVDYLNQHIQIIF